MRSFITFIIALAGITQLSAEQRNDKILIQGNPAGNQTIKIDAEGRTHVEYSYNDRGRGDHITATWKLDAAGVPTEYEGRGNDYMKAPVEERFDLKNGKAHWKNRSEQGEQSVTGEAFYIPLMRRQNSVACSRVLCSKRRVTSCDYCRLVKQVSRRRASSVPMEQN
jgi:hypothetical protein